MSRLSSYRSGSTIHRRNYMHQDVFPLLDSKEITVCLQSLDFVATEELVARPTSQFVRSLFELFLDTFMVMSPELLQEKAMGLAKPETGKPDHDGNHEIVNGNHDQVNQDHESVNGKEDEDTKGAINLIVLHRGAYRFLQGCGIYDLTLSDIARPEPLRTRRILSAVINFARFRDEHSAECEQLVYDTELNLERIKKVEMENDRTHEQLRSLKTRIESSEGDHKKATLKQINAYNARLESELKKLKVSQEILTMEHSQYKVEKARLADKLEDQTYLIMEATKDIDRLKAYSATDLEVLKQVIAELKSQIEEYQSQYDDHERRDRNLAITIESIQVVESELKSLFRILEEILNDLIKEKNALDDLNSTQEYLDQQDVELSDLTRQIQQYERQMINMQEKIDKLKVQSEDRIKKSQQQLSDYRRDYTKLVEERDLKEQEFGQKKEHIADIEANINKKKSDFQLEVRNLDLKLARLNAQVKLYLEEVGKKVFE